MTSNEGVLHRLSKRLESAGEAMVGGYAPLFSTYTDEQLLELARRRDDLVGAARDVLDQELRKRGYDPESPEKPAAPTTFSVDPANLKLNVVSRFFVQAPSWGIFLIVCVVGLFAYAVELSGVRKGIDLVAASLVVGILATICDVAWEWSLGSFLSRVTNPALRMRPTLFQVSVGVLLISLPLTILFFLYPVHFYWYLTYVACVNICQFYLMYFIAKNLVLAERSAPVSFYDYAAPFFMIWFLPIGIWRLQPRVARLYETRVNSVAKVL